MCVNFQLKRTTLTFLVQICPKRKLGFEIHKTNVGIRISVFEIPCVPIFRHKGQLWILGPNLPKNGFWGRKFKNLSLDSESTNLQIHWKTPVPGSFFTKKDSGTGVFLYEISKNTFSYIKLPVAASKYRPYAVNFMLLLIFSKTSRQSRRNATILPWVFNILDSWPQWIYLSIALIHQDIDGVIRPMWRGYFELDVAISTFYRNCNYNIHDILRVKVTIQCWSEH